MDDPVLYDIVFTPTIRLRNGKVLVAAHYGRKVWCLRIKRKGKTEKRE
jgi:hypothetical protein